MKRYLSPVFFSVLAFGLFFTSTKSNIDDVVRAMQTGNSAEVAKYFDDNVDLSMPGKSDNYSKAQAQAILKDFFSNNGAKGFVLKHKGDSPGGEFCSGTLQTNAGNFRTNIFMKIKGNNEVVREMQFQPTE